MDRRAFLNLSAAGAVTGLATVAGSTSAFGAGPALSATTHHARQRISYQLPKSDTPRWAWTIDDGVSATSIRNYLNHALHDPSLKFTYFVTSMYPSWKSNAPALKELMARGQVQLANHTHSHKDLRTLTARGVQRQLLDCQHFLEDEFGVTNSAFWRPPYGFFDFRVLAAAADAGFTAPMMWFGVFGTDSASITLPKIYDNVRHWVQDGRIVLDHANFPLASQHFSQLMDIIRPKQLQLVTLAEAFPTY
jgi:peptidoglycan/xylan/chitin deacetylase (PgdA/CDA1 family)